MIDTMMINLILLSCTCAMGWGIIAYSGYADSKGQICGAWFAPGFSWLKGLGYIAILGPLVAALVIGPWWHLLVVVMAAYILTNILFVVMSPTGVQALLGMGVIPLLFVTTWRVWPMF